VQSPKGFNSLSILFTAYWPNTPWAVILRSSWYSWYIPPSLKTYYDLLIVTEASNSNVIRSRLNKPDTIQGIFGCISKFRISSHILDTVSSSNSNRKRRSKMPISSGQEDQSKEIVFHLMILASHEVCMLWRRHATWEGYWQLINIQMYRMRIKRQQTKEETWEKRWY
jgi:hypothetical protein